MNILGTEVMKVSQWEKAQSIGKNIAEIRKELGITQENLAKMLGISRRALCSYECGKASVPVALIPEIAEIFKISVTKLLDVQIPILDERTKEARILRELEKVNKLPKTEQKVVFTLIDSLAAKHAQAN